ncbi:hypothetical protein [Spiroplasma endosymbiont of Aspidapion aeneum]|uniref:hypothetical protein n=1 Tax=Spiroplasma endosymbiont of Aspidapion aeneum TaxID=3066276 RepID=UPI00313AC9A7
MLEKIDFTEKQTNEILKYYRILVFLFQDCLIESKKHLEKRLQKFIPDIDKIITNIEEIEFLDEFEIISEKFNHLLEKIKYFLFSEIKEKDVIVDFFANYYLLVQASAIKNIILFALNQSWENVLNQENILSYKDIIDIFKLFIKTTKNEIIISNKKDKIFKGDDLFYIQSLDDSGLNIEEIINITDAILENCDGENAYCDYNLIGEAINDLTDPKHTVYQEYVNKILAINIYAICIKELKILNN